MPIKINSTGGGSVSIDVPSTGGTYTLTAPANNATIFTTAGGAITGNVAVTGVASFSSNVTFTSNNVSIGGNSISPFGGKNRIINGDFKIWQRSSGSATSVTSNGVGYTGPDRFFLYQNNASPGVQSVRVAGPTGFQYALKWGRPSGNTKTDVTVMGQALETSNSIDLAGQTVTLSFWAKAGDNFSSSANGLYVSVYSGTGTDQSASNMTTASWTGSATPIATTQTLTTTWTRYTFTGTLGSTVSQLGLYMNWVPTGTAGADDYVYITGIQLEVGPVATPFEFRQYGTELALCQRYFEILGRGMIGTSYSQFIGVGASYKVTKRATPTVTLLTSSPTFYMFAIGIVTGTSSTISVQGNDTSSIGVYFAGMPNQAVTGYFCTSTTDSLLSIAAEL